MTKEEDRQAMMTEYETRPVQLSPEAYAILSAEKNQLRTKHKKNFTFSDAVIELKNKRKGTNIEFTKDEISQIKNTLKGGLK